MTAERLLERASPSFVNSYMKTKDFFKNELYLREAPSRLYDLFWKENGPEYERFWTAVEKGEVHRL